MSDEQDDEQKTEQPTGKKLSQARESGNLPISKEVGNWFLFLGIILAMALVFPLLAGNLLKHLRPFIETPHLIRIGDHNLQRILSEVLVDIGLPVLLIFIILAAAVITGTLAQTGFYASAAPLQFSWDKLNPIKGMKTMFSKAALVELGKGFLKIGVVGYVAYLLLRPYVDEIDHMIGRDLADIGDALQQEAFGMMLMLMFVISLIAVIDLTYRRYAYYKSLRMTKQEVKDEIKQSEGDPMIKMRQRQMRMEKARKRMMASVPSADVVLTNPTHFAVALRYDGAKMQAPVMVAKGADNIALKIREVAEKHGVPLVENPPLTRAIYQNVEIDQEIPPQHYRAVAEIISYVYRLKKGGRA